MNPLQTAILRHTTADGQHHFDWLLAQTEIVLADAREILCWRCPRLLTAMIVNERMIVQAIGKHRGVYVMMDVAHELDGDRGTVETVARGWAQELHDLPALEHSATAQPATSRDMTILHETPRCRHFILRFANTAPLCVTLQSDQLTRLDDTALRHGRD